MKMVKKVFKVFKMNNTPCPPAPRKGYSLLFNQIKQEWEYIKLPNPFY